MSDAATRPQLYMWSGARDSLLQRHDFYVSQIRAKVFPQFAAVEREAEAHANAEYERLALKTGPDRFDPSELAEFAKQQGQVFYGLLQDLQVQVYLGALAGLYHQWDKDLRDFLERELQHDFEQGTVQKVVWESNSGTVFDLLGEFGWDCRAEPFFNDLEASRLLVNSYKHGKGASLTQLVSLHKEFVDSVLLGMFGSANADHEWLRLSEEQFERLAYAMRAFWTAFPERLFLNT